jgi:hypothetical protein
MYIYIGKSGKSASKKAGRENKDKEKEMNKEGEIYVNIGEDDKKKKKRKKFVVYTDIRPPNPSSDVTTDECMSDSQNKGIIEDGKIDKVGGFEAPSSSSVSVIPMCLDNSKLQNNGLIQVEEGEKINNVDIDKVESERGGGGTGGTFSVGCYPQPLNAPKGNALFPELMLACFELEKAICPHRIPSSTIGKKHLSTLGAVFYTE